MKQKRERHDYTNEVELKSLLIREKNKKMGVGNISDKLNDEIDNLIIEYSKTKSKKLKSIIIDKSSNVQINSKAHERFGNIILLIIKKILTKPNFSGYSWRDDFYSDSCCRIFNYLHNFEHDKKSQITGQDVSAFSYISQIIHNSIVAIIKMKHKIAEECDKLCEDNNRYYGLDTESKNKSRYVENENREKITITIDSLNYDDIHKIINEHNSSKNINICIMYRNGVLSADLYAKISPLLNKSKNIINIIKVKNGGN